MIILIIIAALVALLAVWIIQTAGWRFLVRRVLGALLIIFIVTLVTTWLLRQTPGDPCITALGTGATEDAVAKCTSELGLDKNLFSQYFSWVGDVFSGDVIEDYKTQSQMGEIFRQFAPRSALLFLYAQIIGLGLAVPIGVWSAYQAGRSAKKFPPRWLLPLVLVALIAVGFVGGWSLSAVIVVALLMPVIVYHGWRGGPRADNAVNIAAFALLSIPVFVLAEVLRYEFAIKRGWYDIVGYVPWSDGAIEHIKSIWLPAIVLGMAISPIYLRLLRTDMVQNLQQDFVSVAKAKGMSNRHILVRHVLRPSTVTLLTVLGLNIAQLVNGAVVVEYIYDLDGMGSYLLDAVARRRFFAVQTVTAVVAVLFVFTNMIVDVFYTAVDPRVSADDD